MPVDAARTTETRARTRKRKLDAQAGVGFPGLPFEVVVTHVLRKENLPDPADLCRLRGVSRALRDAVHATGRRIMDPGEGAACILGYLTTLRCQQRRGLLSRKEIPQDHIYLIRLCTRPLHVVTAPCATAAAAASLLYPMGVRAQVHHGGVQMRHRPVFASGVAARRRSR